MPSIGVNVDSNISQRCKKCSVLLYISKNFKKHQKICNICCDMLDNEREWALYILFGLKIKNLGFPQTFIFKVQEI